jgi:hypothetical protein
MKCPVCENELGEHFCDYCGSKLGINTKIGKHYVLVCPNMGCPYFGYSDEQLEQGPLWWRADYKTDIKQRGEI